jgi:hypothetical protein
MRQNDLKNGLGTGQVIKMLGMVSMGAAYTNPVLWKNENTLFLLRSLNNQ